MYPGMMHWWRSHHRAHHHEARVGCSPTHERHGHRRDWVEWQASGGDDLGAGAFGVRRPLRFLAHKLELRDEQVEALARILGTLKTERAQADVDGRRATAGLADAVAGDAFDDGRATEGAQRRVDSAQQLRDAVVHALREMHAVLDPGQRTRLAYLIRTGTIAV